jgi:hypothetical protein
MASFLFYFVFDTGSFHVAQAGLEFEILSRNTGRDYRQELQAGITGGCHHTQLTASGFYLQPPSLTCARLLTYFEARRALLGSEMAPTPTP